jgi:hypothetical protein
MLPGYKGRQMYMHTFDIENPKMPPDFEDYLEPVKQALLNAGATKGKAHLTVDEKVVKKGMSQRRPKPHVDGVFLSHPTPHWGQGGERCGGTYSGWAHGCNALRGDKPARMAVIIAASAVGARAWRGEFDAEPASDGDLSHLPLPEGEVLPANKAFLLSPDCIHESLIQERDTERVFMRIALPLEFRFN